MANDPSLVHIIPRRGVAESEPALSLSDPDPPGLGGLEEAPGLAGGTPRREVRRLGPPAGRQTHQTVWKPPHGGQHQDLLVRHDTSSKPQSLGAGGLVGGE